MLSDSESESGSGADDVQLTINDHFAKSYAYRKEREELSKLKEKYGSDGEDFDDEEDSEDAESEDEDGEELTPAMDAAILRTLARIRRKDPEIYQAEKSVLNEEKETLEAAQPTRKRTKQPKIKGITLRQQAIDSALNLNASRSASPEPQPLTHVEEQRALRKETVSAFHEAATDSEEDDLLVPREKTKDEVEEEEEEYREFLEREVGEDIRELITVEPANDEGDEVVNSAEEVPEGKKKKKRDKKKGLSAGDTRKAKEEQDRDFLMNYIFNRGWIDHTARRVPTYKEITKTSSFKTTAESDDEAGPSHTQQADENEDLDEEFEDVVDHFESSYNFRYEEPDAAEIKRYPRTVQSTVRREDTTRKEGREKRRARKEEELARKREEVARLKALKTKELQRKLERITREGGKELEDEALKILDLDKDWDPGAHDQQMAGLYGAEGDGDAEDYDEEKPTWNDDIDIDDILPPTAKASSKEKKKKKSKKRKGADDEDGVDLDVMDADVQHDLGDEEWDGTEEMRKRVLDKYMDEILGLEFNDMVGDLPTRFKYTSVANDTFGLDPVEILRATDAELNSYVGLRQFAPYREGKKRWDNSRNERLQEFRGALAARGVEARPSYGKRQREGEDGEQPVKRRKGKKERMKAKAAQVQLEEE